MICGVFLARVSGLEFLSFTEGSGRGGEGVGGRG